MKGIRTIMQGACFCLAALVLLSGCATEDGNHGGISDPTETVTASAPEPDAGVSSIVHRDPSAASRQDSAASVYTTVGTVTENVRREGDLVYLDALSPLVELAGIPHPNDNHGEYYRLDAGNKNAYPSDIRALATNTTGVTLRFCVTADSFVLKVTMRNVSLGMMHFADNGVYGFDVYVGTGTDRKLVTETEGYLLDTQGFTHTVTLPSGYQEVMIDLPLYAGVSKVEIGLKAEDGIALPAARDYGNIVFYGSSITQGACVSRPGLAYPSVVCRMLNATCRNLGFSGSARGEQVMVDYLASLEMEAFILDYDWNAASWGWLEMTHYNVYKTVRDAHPDIPIIMMSRPVFAPDGNQDQLQRQKVIMATYQMALDAGDTNVYFINGDDFYPFAVPDLATVDQVHPNDIGHYYMALAVYEVLKPVLDAAPSPIGS